MNVILISDTHNLHRQLDIPQGDILIHAGDVSVKGTEEEVLDFLAWFSEQPHPHKVFIAGNHDYYFEQTDAESIKTLIPKNIHYLKDELLEIAGLKIWGSPTTPIPNRRWAFNKERGKDIQQQWDLIPEDLDILIVHGPAQGMLDKILSGERVGCQNLLESLKKKKPKLFVFGHIHESRGLELLDSIQFVNASSVDRHRTKVFPPFIFEYQEASKTWLLFSEKRKTKSE